MICELCTQGPGICIIMVSVCNTLSVKCMCAGGKISCSSELLQELVQGRPW